MESISKQDLKAILEKLEEPLRLKDLARQLNLLTDEDTLALEKYLKECQTELEINLVEIPYSENKENYIEYILEYKPADGKENYDHLNDQELMKVYQGLVFKVNKLKDQKLKLNTSEVKNKYIKALHKYNDLKDIGQVVIGKLAELQAKTVQEVYEEYDLDVKD